MITIANPEKYIAGLYERLSNENIEVGNGEVIETKEDEQESGSISTQKLFLRNFCKDNNIQVYDDYTDDGVSGATFDRPDFNRMIKDIENKKINLIAVKDLSRFGRLSSKISYYLEEFFIEKGVRFIAVTDDIDTGHIETSEEMVQFKAFFNEWFLRDTSRKVRNGKKTRAKEGKVMTTYPTYGYKKDPLDYNHYVIDQDIAPIVRRIFMLARNGMTPTEIGKILTDERTLVPSEIVGNGHTRKEGIKRGWNRNTVKRILQNVTYLGWLSNGNTKKINYKSKKTMIMPKENRIIVKGMHTPIIDEETFNIVQDMIKSRTSTRVKSYDWLLIKARTAYKVSYNANGGTMAPSAQPKIHGTDLKLTSSVPTRDGYTFKGWATSPNGTVSMQPGGIYSGNANITYYAVWDLTKYYLLNHADICTPMTGGWERETYSAKNSIEFNKTANAYKFKVEAGNTAPYFRTYGTIDMRPYKKLHIEAYLTINPGGYSGQCTLTAGAVNGKTTPFSQCAYVASDSVSGFYPDGKKGKTVALDIDVTNCDYPATIVMTVENGAGSYSTFIAEAMIYAIWLTK